MFPRASGTGLTAVILNTAGGLTGGDRFSFDARASAGSRLTLTTQAAERAYRALPGEEARVETRLHVEPGARLDWLPQETILFDGCALARSLRVDLAPGAELLLVEPVIFGRAAMGERLTGARFSDRIELRRGSAPLYLDATRLEGDVAAQLARPAIAGGAGAMAALLLVSEAADAELPAIRAMMPDTAGASLIGGDLLAARILAPDGHALRASLVPILTRLTGGVPKPWMI